MAIWIKTFDGSASELPEDKCQTLETLKDYICSEFQTKEYNILLKCEGITIDSTEKLKKIEKNSTIHLTLLSPLVYSIGNGVSEEIKIINYPDTPSIFKIPEIDQNDLEKYRHYENKLDITIYQWGGYEYGLDEDETKEFNLIEYFRSLTIEAKDTPYLEHITSLENCFYDGYQYEFEIGINGEGEIQFICDLPEAVQLAAVKQNEFAIRFIKDPSEEVQLAAVKKYGCVIGSIKDPSEAVQLEAVKQRGYAIEFIKDPSEEVKLAAVKQNGNVIKYIENPSEEVQLAAVKKYGGAIKYIENPSEEVKLAAEK